MIGVDNYSYHRLLGEVRPGEAPSPHPPMAWQDTVTAAAAAGAEVVALETCFMDRASAARALSEPLPIEVMLSWGHPYGLQYGASPEAEEDAAAWLATAAALGHRRMRIVVAHPHLRPADGGQREVQASVPALTRLASAAAAFGIVLAIENHADLTAEQLAWLVAEVGSASLAVCFDVANAVRVGDDPVIAARTLAPISVAAHVKDLASDPWHPRSGPRSVPLGTGTMPLDAVLEELRNGGRDPWLLVELAHLGAAPVDELAMIAGDVSWLNARSRRPAAGPRR
jgi:sugar phosphate isomerase/epimerase